jgi:Domain of unknown function (DUF4292)
MRKILPLILISLLLSCKAKKKLVAPEAVTTTASNETVANIIKNHYAVKYDFKTAFIKADVEYQDPKQTLSISADIRIKKDEIILVSLKWFGITMAKAMITPDRVRYYEKLNGKYFDGDYQVLSDLLGTDLDFKKVQNLLLGQAIDNLNKNEYSIVQEGDAPKLEEIAKSNFNKSYVFEPVSFWLRKQEIKQISPERTFLANYSNYKSFENSVFPMELTIFAVQNNQTTSIAIQNNNVTFNEELSFPYNVPGGYKEINIKK